MIVVNREQTNGLKVEQHLNTYDTELFSEIIKRLEIENQELKQEKERLEGQVDELTQIIEALKGKLRNFAKNMFDKKSERLKYIKEFDDKDQEPDDTDNDKVNPTEFPDIPSADSSKSASSNLPKPVKKKRLTPHGRKIPDNLPVEEVVCVLPDEECTCPKCSKMYRETVLEEESSEIDIVIKVIRKVFKRRVYAKTCNCDETPTMLTAPKPPNIIYKSLYSTSLWVLLLVLKYYAQIPIYRQVNNIWGQYGTYLNNSTITGGFKKLTEILIPLYNKFIEVSRQEEHWHADETRWKVFVDKQGKKTFNWWMWLFASAKVVVYVLDRTRSSDVPKKYFGDNASGIINVDRYAAYYVLAEMIRRALCWYHERRDFIRAAEAFPELEGWSLEWVERIHILETINDARVAALNDDNEFDTQQKLLEAQVLSMQDTCQNELEVSSHSQQIKVLRSLTRNWEGLTVFVSNPLVPMHNNLAENGMRPVALARNNYYGSRSEWSGQLAAMCMSICKTAEMHGFNPQAYMEFYFNICAKNDSRAPDNLESLLPWNLSDEAIDAYNLRKHNKNAS